MAAYGVSSEFDYFQSNIISGDIEDEYVVAFNTTQAIQEKLPLEFTIPAEPGVYRDLNNTVLEVTCKVAAANGGNIAANLAVAPVNLLLHALFKSCEIQLNGKRVTDSNSYYAERAYIEKLLNCPEKILNTRGICEGWYMDECGKTDKIVLRADNAANVNKGFVARSSWCAESKTMKFAGRLHSDLFHQPLDLPDNVKIDIRLDQNKNEKVLMGAADVTSKIVIMSARLLVRSKRLSPDLVLAHKSLLAQRNYRIPFTRVLMKADTIATGATEMVRSSFYQGIKPNRMTIVMVRSTNTTGALTRNPFLFENFALNSICLKVGKDRYPHEELSMDYAQGSYTAAYLNTLASLGLDQGDRALPITPAEWASDYNIYSFKLTPGSVNPLVVHPSQAKPLSIELHVKFSAGVPEPITILAYIEEPALLEIDKFNNVIV